MIEINIEPAATPSFPIPMNNVSNVVFKCPRTGLNVQHRLDESRSGDSNCTYESVVCKACTRLHFINRSTGRLLGQDRT